MKKLYLVALSVLMMVALGCSRSNDEGATKDKASVTIQSAITAENHDVGGFLYDVECDNGFTLSQYVGLEEEFLPPWLDPAAGDMHFFSDLLAVIPPGLCTVTATPMQDSDTPSEVCHPVSGEFVVEPELTTEIVLMAQCDGDPNGAADIVAGLNDPPVIVGLELSPSKFITECDELTMEVTAEDPNGDALTYTWELVTQPFGAIYSFVPNGNVASFLAQTPGYYEFRITAIDTYGASTSLIFPVHVSDVPEIETCDEKDTGYVNENCITFESIFDNEEIIPTYDTQIISDEYKVDAGVSFELVAPLTNTHAGYPRIAMSGSPATAFASAWGPDVVYDGNIGFDLGETFLTDDTGYGVSTDLLIHYDPPVFQTGAWLLDVDCRPGVAKVPGGGCEEWTITAYDEFGMEIDQTIVEPPFLDLVDADGRAHGNDPGDAIAQFWSFDSPLVPIHSVRLNYSGNASGVGVAFDHFCTDELPVLVD